MKAERRGKRSTSATSTVTGEKMKAGLGGEIRQDQLSVASEQKSDFNSAFIGSKKVTDSSLPTFKVQITKKHSFP